MSVCGLGHILLTNVAEVDWLSVIMKSAQGDFEV